MNFKELEKLIKFCRKQGISKLRLENGMELTLNPEKPLSKYMKKKKGVTGELSTGNDDPMAKMPSDSDLLMWSSPAYDVITETRKETEPRGL